LFNNINLLLALDNYLGIACVPERPFLAKDVRPQPMKDIYKLSKADVDKGIDVLKSHKKNNNPTGFWPLDAPSIHSWRNPVSSDGSKNMGRDYEKWVVIALTEMKITDEYRATMFENCQAAIILRLGLKDILTHYAKPRNTISIAPNGTISYGTSNDYDFPDGIQVDCSQLEPDYVVDIDDEYYQKRQLERMYQDRKDINDICKFLDKKGIMASVPGGKYTDPVIYEAATTFIQVMSFGTLLLWFCELMSISPFSGTEHTVRPSPQND
jgi:hypothetical protein